MSIAKTHRPRKRQLGQFMTPLPLARRLLMDTAFSAGDRVLEPSMGDGAFVVALIERFLPLYDGPLDKRLDRILQENIYGIEIDPALYAKCLQRIREMWGHVPSTHSLVRADFFSCHLTRKGWLIGSAPPAPTSEVRFDYIVGNPPFGGTIDPALQDELDALYGFRNGEKIKKETYSFFIAKALDMLAPGGKLMFICSDTFLTIKTMRGLRRLLMDTGSVELADLDRFSAETSQPMVFLRFTNNAIADGITLNGQRVGRDLIELARNLSWRMTPDVAQYFGGPVIGDFMVATSGMTIGRNEYFLREIRSGRIFEPYSFEFYDERITLDGELARARLGRLSGAKRHEIERLEAAGATRRAVRLRSRPEPTEVPLPHPDYCYYNKAVSAVVYSPPTHVIYWKDDGDAVLTFKKAGNWYLHGVGGQRYFKREGLTWQLIAAALNTRYLPPGYILDSGAPCAFLRQGVARDELFFILGWTLTRLCTRLLKEVINHTKNIQSKDFERLPYPFWVSETVKEEVVRAVKAMVRQAVGGTRFTRANPQVRQLEEMFAFRRTCTRTSRAQQQLGLFAGAVAR